MAREAKQRSTQASRQSSRRRSSLPGWVWGLFGLSAGLFIALLVYLQSQAPTGTAAVSSLLRPHASDAAGDGPPPSTGQAPTPDNGPTHPRFEFYKLLPDQKVEIPTPEPNPEPFPTKRPTAEHSANAEHSRPQTTETTTPQAAPPDTQEPSADYLLQVGSFRRLNEADQLKARLALLGVEASIQNVELAKGETWHRVRIGPFNDRQHLSEIRKRLQANKIHAIVLKHGG